MASYGSKLLKEGSEREGKGSNVRINHHQTHHQPHPREAGGGAGHEP